MLTCSAVKLSVSELHLKRIHAPLRSVPEDAFQENYTEEPLPEPEEAPAVETPRGAAAQEQEDEE